MPALTLPLTFSNSFWSKDYRKGLEQLYHKLHQGIEEDSEVVNFIRARASTENALADTLTSPVPTGARGTGFGADDGASLLVAFQGLQQESIAQGEAHRTVARDLETLVAGPLELWAEGHKNRVQQNEFQVMENWLVAYEQSRSEVDYLRNSYLAKTRRADEAEDDAKFAPNNDIGDRYTSSPRLGARDARLPTRKTTISERITQRFKDMGKTVNGDIIEGDPLIFDEHLENQTEIPITPVDKGKGKAIEEPPRLTDSPPPLSPALPPKKLETRVLQPPIQLAGVSFSPEAVSDLLKRAAAEMGLRPVKFAILGEYPDCFNGDEFVGWLAKNVKAFGGGLDAAEAAAVDLTEGEGLLRRVGEFGNKFEALEDAWYQFKPKAFELKDAITKQESPAPSPTSLAPIAGNIVKRSNTLVNFVSKALVSTPAEPLYVKTRKEAIAAERDYKIAVRKLDRQRLALEDKVEDTLRLLQKMETERLNTLKSALLQYQGTLSHLHSVEQASFDKSSILISSYIPESDIRVSIERYRTGPFKPTAHIYESIAHNEFDVHFGIDLHRWSDVNESDQLPDVLAVLLEALDEAYGHMANDRERRKSWIYEVPLHVVHRLRESINAIVPGKPIPASIFSQYDAPVIANCVKLWCLELSPPLMLWENWDDVRKLYPVVGARRAEQEPNQGQHMQDIQVALLRLPKIHLYVLDAIISHLKKLVEITKDDEPNDIYYNKLALSLGRALLRPQEENEMSIQDRHPTLLFMDLMSHYDEILPPAVTKKRRESDRSRLPTRKRTAMVDMRVSRSRLSVGQDGQGILAAQLVALNPKSPNRALSPAPRATSTRAMSPPATPPANFSIPVPPAQAPPPPVTDPVVTAVPPPPPQASHTPSPPTPTAPLVSPPTVPAVPPPPPLVAPVPAAPLVVPPPPPLTASEPVNYRAIPPPPPIAQVPTPPNGDEPIPRPPVFKEAEDTPVRPSFREPTSDGEDMTVRPPSFKEVLDDETELPMPAFVEPPQESAHRVIVTPPVRPQSQSPPPRHSPSPTMQHTESTRVGLRGPRQVRGARPPSLSGGSVSSLVSNLNRSSLVTPPPGRRPGSGGMRPISLIDPKAYEPKRGARTAQAGAFSRRTMASDAEDEIVDK